jgi:hypothetical protein
MDDAPSPSPEDRATAAAHAIRARREADAADRAAARSRSLSTRGPRRTALIAAGATAALLATAAVIWGVVQVRPPSPQETVAGPTATSTPSPSATPTPAPTYTLVQVGEDLVANPPEDIHSLEMHVWPDTLVAATALGEHAGWTARGMLSDTGRFCMSLTHPDHGGHGTCTPGELFMVEGITVDRGAWDVRWMADGTVTWNGI